MKPKKLFIILIIILLIGSGCWDARQLNDLDIVLGVAVDKAESNTFELTLQSAKPSASTEKGGSSSEKYLLTSAIGHSMFDAARNITLHLPRRNYWPHTQTIVIGETLAKDGITGLVDFFVRDSQRRLPIRLTVTEETGKSILAIPPSSENYSAIEIKKMIEHTTSTGYGVKISLEDFIEDSQGFAGVSLINKIKPREKSPENKKESTNLTLDGVGVFYNYKLIGYINPKETRATNWLRDDIKTSIITFDYDDDNKDDITIEISKSKTKFKPKIIENQFVMSANVTIEGDIVEFAHTSDIQALSLEKMNSSLSHLVKNQIEQIFTKAQEELEVDIFKFGEKFGDKYPELVELKSEEWKKIFINQCKLDLNVEVKVKFSGTTIGKKL